MKFEYENNKIYALDENNNRVGVIEFEQIGENEYNIYHTEVNENMKGQGIASMLVRKAVEYVDKHGGKIRATCSYANDWLKRYKGSY